MRVDPTNDTFLKSELIFRVEKEALSGVGSTERIYELCEYMSEEFQICLIFKSAVVFHL